MTIPFNGRGKNFGKRKAEKPTGGWKCRACRQPVGLRPDGLGHFTLCRQCEHRINAMKLKHPKAITPPQSGLAEIIQGKHLRQSAEDKRQGSGTTTDSGGVPTTPGPVPQEPKVTGSSR